MRRGDIPAFTALRFFAAGLVVLGHYNFEAKIFGAALAGFGYQSVTFFFILSGFIMAWVYLAGKEPGKFIAAVPVRHYLSLRLARILPAYFLALVVSFPFFLNVSAANGSLDLGAFVLGLVAVPTLTQAWIPHASTMWNIAAWSLSVELFFYLLFPVLAWLTARLSWRQFLILAAGLIVAMEGLRHVSGELLTDAMSRSNREFFLAYFPLFHLPLFVFGMALARATIATGSYGARFAGRGFSLALAAIVVAIWLHPEQSWISNPVVLAVLFGTLIYTGSKASGVVVRALSRRELLVLGEASYAIYILHIPLLLWWRFFFPVGAGSSMFDFIVFTSALIAIAVLVSRYIEPAGRAYVLRLFDARQRTPSPLVQLDAGQPRI